MAHDARWEAVRAVAGKLNGWRAIHDGDYRYVLMRTGGGPETGAEVLVLFRDHREPMRARVVATWPTYVRSVETPGLRQTVEPTGEARTRMRACGLLFTRDPAQLAADIRRRVLDWYLPLYRTCAERAVELHGAEEEQARQAQRLADMVVSTPVRDGRTCYSTLPDGRAVRVKVESDGTASVELRVPLPLAFELLRSVRAYHAPAKQR